MDLWRIAIRAIVAYVYVLLLVRLTGKRVVSQLTPIHFVTAVIVGDLFDDLMWAEVSAAEFFAAAGALFLADATAEWGSHASRGVFRLVNGEPTAFISHGHEDHHALRREQLNEGDLEHLLRMRGISRNQWDEVRIGALEIDHELSVLREPMAERARRIDLEVPDTQR